MANGQGSAQILHSDKWGNSNKNSKINKHILQQEAFGLIYTINGNTYMPSMLITINSLIVHQLSLSQLGITSKDSYRVRSA